MIDRLTIRMYQMGFGDCFLLGFWQGDSARYVLIDCGTISEGSGQVSAVAANVIETVREKAGGRIELVVATHRHRDHVGGFKDSAAWNQIEVGEVWMPWTEDPDDPEGTRIRDRQSGFAAALTRSMKVAGETLDDDLMADAPAEATEEKQAIAAAMQRVALNALTNESAMATLHRGFKGRARRRFLPDTEGSKDPLAIPNVAGVAVHVLGPPRTEEALKNMDPPKEQAYLRAGAAGETSEVAESDKAAFGASWRIAATEPAPAGSRRRPAFRQLHAKSTFSKEDRAVVKLRADEPSGDLAAAIDKAVNNTSLILMFEVGEHWLLFPGDAQWGGWKAALDDPRARRLLERTTFYKVGHHGSENATPKELIESVIGEGFLAFFSTLTRSQWPNIPRGPLVEAVEKKGRVVRSDRFPAAGDGFTVVPNLFVEWEVPLAG